MSDTTDALRRKTDAELLFFVQHPSLYQPSLVAAAQRELARRSRAAEAGTAAAPSLPGPPAPGAPAPSPPFAPPAAGPTLFVPTYDVPPLPPENPFDQPEAPRRWLLPAFIVLGLAALGLLLYSTLHSSAPTMGTRPPAHLPADSLTLTVAPSFTPPPTDPDGDLTRQLQQVPAAEQRAASVEQFRQYRVLGRRFWQAQRSTEYVLARLDAPQANSSRATQLDYALNQWHDLNQGLAYGFDFPPTMSDQLLRIRVIARIEQGHLRELLEQDSLHPAPLTHRQQLTLDTAAYLLRGLQQKQKLRVNLGG